jgi:hypothetical protein
MTDTIAALQAALDTTSADAIGITVSWPVHLAIWPIATTDTHA